MSVRDIMLAGVDLPPSWMTLALECRWESHPAGAAPFGATPEDLDIPILSVREDMLDRSRETRQLLVEHELAHVVWGHAQRCGDRDEGVWNLAADAWINHVHRLPQRAVADTPECLSYASLAEHYTQPSWTLPRTPEDLYDLMWTAGVRSGEGGCEHSPAAVVRMRVPRRPSQRIRELARDALAQAPGGSSGTALRPTPPPACVETPPRWVIRLAAIAREALDLAERRSWRRLARVAPPGVMLPGRGTRWCEARRAMVGLDVSGSMSDADVTRLTGWARGLARSGVGGDILSFDTRITARVPLTHPLSAWPGGGGTNYAPVWRAAAESGARLLVLASDGYPCSMPSTPPTPRTIVVAVVPPHGLRDWPGWARAIHLGAAP
jgi:hypothetical protein